MKYRQRFTCTRHTGSMNETIGFARLLKRMALGIISAAGKAAHLGESGNKYSPASSWNSN